jgi:hypothetical protein
LKKKSKVTTITLKSNQIKSYRIISFLSTASQPLLLPLPLPSPLPLPPPLPLPSPSFQTSYLIQPVTQQNLFFQKKN